VHHSAKADAYVSARMHKKAAGHRARAQWHLRARFGFGAPTSMATWLTEGLTDPLTLDVFVDPVVISTGHTFERAQITELTGQHAIARCPVTRKRFTDTYVQNTVIRQLVRWCDTIADRTELQNAEELATKLSNPETSELLLYPVVVHNRTLGGYTFEREVFAAIPSPDPLVPNRLVRSIVEQFVSAYARHPDDDDGDWARVRAACATYLERKRTTESAPEYLHSVHDLDWVVQAALSDELTDEAAVQHIIQRARREGQFEFDGPDDARYILTDILPRGRTRPELDHRFDEWSSRGY
jgi:hypothetical protein